MLSNNYSRMTNATKATTQLTILLVPKQKHEQTLRDSKYLSAKDSQRAVFSAGVRETLVSPNLQSSWKKFNPSLLLVYYWNRSLLPADRSWGRNACGSWKSTNYRQKWVSWFFTMSLILISKYDIFLLCRSTGT